jgi:oligopeptide transport system substrate-binding protein
MNERTVNKIYKLFVYLCLSVFICGFISCSEINQTKSEPYYSETEPPNKQEFRWSNGKMPKSFDPALASSPPESDIVRAVFEGLTELDANTLEAKSAVATDWKSSNNNKTWTFNLRKNAKWSNGESVTAHNFVKSWNRLVLLRDKVAERKLLKNIADTEILPNENVNENIDFSETITNDPIVSKTENKAESVKKIGVQAVDDWTLKISLIKPDKDLPKLVAHPIFRPVYDADNQTEITELKADIVTNGAFRIVSVGIDGVTIDRSENYWNKENISLQRVRFVPAENAEKALNAYKLGEVDAITNLHFEPLALKLLTPFQDFKRTTHNALNYYEFNQKKPPFNDVRVREALAISIDRERLTADEMDGSTQPAFTFLPFTKQLEFTHNIQRAKDLLAEAGFPEGKNFPKINLVINRNDMQKRIAKSVSDMWAKHLNIETTLITKDKGEFETAQANRDFDVIRRGVVLPTVSETVNMLSIFSKTKQISSKIQINTNSNVNVANTKIHDDISVITDSNTNIANLGDTNSNKSDVDLENDVEILTQAEANKEVPAIPLYFPTSYSLVKPYVKGFENNVLDAPSLKSVEIDQTYQTNQKNK